MRHDTSHIPNTASPTTAATGEPPNDEKYSMPLFANDSAMAVVVTTAASGNPLPNGLPTVTISGTTPCISNPQKCVPTLPNPTCTSSATHTPPAFRTVSYTLRK